MKTLLVRALLARALLAVALSLSAVSGASAALVFDFANVTNALFRFDGATNSFSFPNGAGGVDFTVTSQNSDWPGSVLNYTGDFIAPGGGWVVDPTGNPANVTGIGTLVLRNAANTATLTGDLDWATIGTLGTVGGINVDGILNFTNLTLAGADANLSALAAAGGATVVVSFQNINVTSDGTLDAGEDCTGLLGKLRCGGVSTGSYSGTLSATVPEPGTLALIALALAIAGLLGARRRTAVITR